MYSDLDQTVLLYAYIEGSGPADNQQSSISAKYSLDDADPQPLGDDSVNPVTGEPGYYRVNVSASECDGLKTFDVFAQSTVANVNVIVIHHDRTLIKRSRRWINDRSETLNFEEQIVS